jgi:hypothetical protein
VGGVEEVGIAMEVAARPPDVEVLDLRERLDELVRFIRGD